MFRRKAQQMKYLMTSDEDDSSDDEPFKARLKRMKEARNEQKDETPQVKIQYDLSIEGVKVSMPVRPYPCQEAVITAIINGCRTQQHCLLESPTGSGKTLALLCGSLAWQTDFANKLSEASDQNKKPGDNGKIGNNDGPSSCKDTCDQAAGKCSTMDENFDLDGFDWSDDSFTNSSSCTKIPTIYYGSRTHRQIEQVVKELRRTCYSHKNMTVLSSREYTCIQDTDRDKTKLCNELLDPTKKCGCPYYQEENKNAVGTTYGLQAYGVETPWDIEDLVAAGKEANCCPYFAARNLMLYADIIFCPYNYIIDPAIRESIDIDLSGSIIILDEAHNIENICRECGSVSLPVDELETMITECENLLQLAAIQQQSDKVGYATVIIKFAEHLLRFVNTTQMKQQTNSDSLNSDQWTGVDFVNVLDISTSISPTVIDNFMRAAREAVSMHNLVKDQLRTGRPCAPTFPHEIIRIIEKTLMGFKMITSTVHASDYRVVVRQIPQGYKKEKTLEFMCMNPGVIFAPICEMARTVILASGTLAPTSSYQGELGVKFPFKLQADHVTPREQVFIKCVSKGPAGTSLRATYQNVNQWGFQDDLGAVVLTVCDAVPHGILMFFSSYVVMGNLLKRWQTNGMFKKFATYKQIFQETRGSSDLTTMMESYREAIRNTSDGPIGTVTGALLFAVFRGKVAEGIDFSDNEARAVLTVGIPYSVRNDPSTDMKFQYNDSNRKKGLLSGHEWYTIQAFRALNQALGRAIRHQNDWGAIILIDERFLEFRNVNLLPAWVRTMWNRQPEINTDLRQLLKCFVARQIRREREKCRSLSNDSV